MQKCSQPSHTRRPNGSCRECSNASEQKWRDQNPDRVRKAGRLRKQREREQHPERSKNVLAKWYSVHWARVLLKSARASSVSRGHPPPTITEEWILSQPLVCPYLGVSLEPYSTEKKGPFRPSLDRIDNDKGYSPENVLLTSWVWNLMRGSHSVERALEILALIQSSSTFLKVA